MSNLKVDEINTFCKTGNMNSLSRADKFVKQLSDIVNYELRIKSMVFIEEFNDLYSKLEKPFETYIECSEQLLKNESLKLFLGIILTFGNFLNSNSYAGKAVGFKISDLTKLTEMKTNVHAINMLHLVVEQFDEMNIKDDFTNDLKDLALVLK